MAPSDGSVQGKVGAWMAAWNEEDAVERRRLLTVAWTGNGRYVDPFVDVAGPDAIATALGQFRVLFPGHSLRRSSGIERHFDQIRFTWELVSPEGTVVSDGVDLAQLDADDRFIHLTGFAGAQVPVPLEA